MVLRIGDRVIVENHMEMPEYCFAYFEDEFKGIITDVDDCDEDDIYYLIQFDEFIGGHNGNGDGPRGHCWYVKRRYVKYLNPLKPREHLTKHRLGNIGRENELMTL